MKKLVLPTLAALTAVLAYAAPADDLTAAAKKLADASSYAWTRTTEQPNSQFQAGPVEGVAEKGGITKTTSSFNGNEFVSYRKGDEMVSKNQEGVWMNNEERRAAFQGGAGGQGGQGGQGRGGAGGGRGFGGGFGGFGGGAGQQNPAEELTSLVGQLKNVKSADGVITGDLSEEAVAQRLSFGGRGRGGQGGQTPPAPKNASGTAKVWVKDGAVTKYQLQVKGTVAGRGGNEMEIDRTTTTEIKNVGSAKVDIPEDAKKKLGA
jgi:hypothetical protein